MKRAGDITINIPAWSSFNVLVSGPRSTGRTPRRTPKERVITPNWTSGFHIYKVDAINEWSVPANAKELKVCLGTEGYHRRYIHNFHIWHLLCMNC